MGLGGGALPRGGRGAPLNGVSARRRACAHPPRSGGPRPPKGQTGCLCPGSVVLLRWIVRMRGCCVKWVRGGGWGEVVVCRTKIGVSWGREPPGGPTGCLPEDLGTSGPPPGSWGQGVLGSSWAGPRGTRSTPRRSPSRRSTGVDLDRISARVSIPGAFQDHLGRVPWFRRSNCEGIPNPILAYVYPYRSIFGYVAGCFPVNLGLWD